MEQDFLFYSTIKSTMTALNIVTGGRISTAVSKIVQEAVDAFDGYVSDSDFPILEKMVEWNSLNCMESK